MSTRAGVAAAHGARTPGTAVSGPVLFARYAYPPNALGYCGPGDPDALLGMASQRTDLAGLRHLAAQFEGAWPYLELIAGCNDIADPLDHRVVEAYWTGNALLARVGPGALASSLDERFAGRERRALAPVVAAVPGGIPQHCFHVFAVYPWLGLLRAGREGPALEVLDRCRIRWGTVMAADGDAVTVHSRPLRFEGARLVLGDERPEVVRGGIDGSALCDPVVPGDTVSLHWDWVCDRLTPAALRWLRHCTARNLEAVNALARPGPAVACGV